MKSQNSTRPRTRVSAKWWNVSALGAALTLFGSTAYGQLTGIKTIGVDYPTLTAAIGDLNTQGVGAGGVTIDVPAGYTETLTGKLTLTATGTLANQIIIQKSGSGANPVLTSYVGTVATPAVTADGFFVLAGSDYVTIDGIDLLESGANTTVTTQMEFGYGLFKASATDGAQNNLIRNCTITLSTLNNTVWTAPGHNGSTGIAVLNSVHNVPASVTVTAASGSNSNNRIYSNTIQNCNAGIVLLGFAATAGVGPAPVPSTFLGDLANDIGGTLPGTGNSILNFGGGAATNPATGVFANNQWGLNVSNNTINNNTGANANHATTLRGIFLNSSSTSASATCSANTITLHAGGTTAQVSWIENSFGATPAGNTIIISNNVLTGDYLTATSGTFYGIYNTTAPSTVNILGNTINGLSYSAASLTGSGAVYPIYCTGNNAATTYNVSGNVVTNVTRTGTTGGTTIGIFMSASLSGMVVNVNNNTVSNMSIDGTGATSTMYGIQVATGTITVTNNAVNNLQCLKAAGTGTLYGIHNIASATVENYSSNTVHTLLHNGTGIVYGIYIFTTTGTRTVSGNTVFNLSTAGNTIAGINNASSSPTVFNNKVYDVRSTNTAPTVSGILQGSLGTAGTANIHNNLIGDLKAPNASSTTTPTLRGINITTATTSANVNVSYNTIHLNGSSSAGSFSTAALFHTTSATATTGALTLRNNILVNLSTPGTGYTVAYWRSSNALNNYTSASNNNLLYAGSAGPSNLLYFDGSTGDQTLVAFKARVAPTRETATVKDLPVFLSLAGVSAQFLHVDPAVPTFAESGGVAIGGITTDFDAEVRNATTPDIGADEFSGTVPLCSQPDASVTYFEDCTNGMFYLDVAVTNLNGSSTVNVGSDYPGDPGADGGVGVGTHQIGPFPSNANVQVLITSNTSPLCNINLGTYTFDCSTNGQNALHFDGVNDRVNLANTLSTNITGTQLTLEAWIYPTAFRTSSFEGSIINKEQATGAAGYMLRCGANGVLSFAIGTGTFPEVTSPAGTLVLNTWQHVAGIYDGATLRIFKDGVQVGSAAQTGTIASSATAPLQIGNWGQSDTRGFIGKIDEVRIWNVARTVPELNTSLNAVLCGTETGLQAYYQFNQGTAGGNNTGITNVSDLGPNGNNATTLNMALTGPTSNWVLGRTGLGACVTCTQPTATASAQQDCANNRFYVNVNVSNLNGGPGVNVVSDYSGNPGAQFAVGTGTYQLGPFASGANVLVTVQHAVDPVCNVSLGTFTYDCSTFGQNALSFDGVNDGVVCGNTASLDITGTQVTLEAWIYPTAFKPDVFAGNIINKEGGFAGYQIRCGGSGVLESALGTGSGYITVTSPTNTLTLNTWQHVAVTYDGANARLYKNGVQVASVAGTAAIVTSPNAMRIGDYAVTPGARTFQGKIDEPRVWNIARSAGDIAAYVNQQLCGNEPGLAAYYHFDQGVADENNAAVTTAIDASTNGNTGTLANFALNGTTSNWVLGKTGLGVCVACTGTPTAGSISGNGSVCNAASNSLTLNGATVGLGISYQWKYGPAGGPYTNLLGTGVSQNTSGIPIGSYEVVVEVTCDEGPTTVATAPFALTIKPVPTASASAGQACTGQTLNLTGTTDIGTTFNWTGPNSFASTAQNPSIAALTTAATGTYTFTATLDGCTSAPATTPVVVGVSPTMGTVSATPATICSGASSQLSASATAQGYVLGSGGAAWTDIAGTGTSVGTVSDDSEHNITIPSFTFNGITYTAGRVGMNGALVLGASTGDVALTNAALPSSSNTAGTIFLAPWWDDLDIQGGAAILTETVGNRFIVQWNNTAHNNATGGLNNVYFQIQMDLITGGVYFVYQDVFWGNATYDQALSGTVGIQWANAAGSFIQYSFNTASLTNGLVISFLPNSPSYSWNPTTFLDNPAIGNPLASGVTAPTTYTVTATAVNGCSVQGTTTVTTIPVDDGDPCTVDNCVDGVVSHTYTDTDNDGTCDGLDGCPLDANKLLPGICGCGVSDVDTDSDGTADCNDGCPLDPNKILAGICGCGVSDVDTDSDGTADCNDGCPLDPNKLLPGLCGCGVPEGTCNDCEGVPAGPAQPGTTCDDGDACTINDLWSPSCVCAGTFQDTDGDSVCDANDLCPGQDDLLDTDNDGTVDCLDNCPLIPGQIGSVCEDGNPNTTGDVVDANCVCAGVIVPCNDNATVLTVTTDNDAAQTTWEIIPMGGGAAVCSGAGFANNSSFGYNCCLPNGCYELRVMDSAGDGMANGSIGGYVLTQTAGNKRIIDNSNDGIFTTLSQVANNQGFCVPLGNDAVLPLYCDKVDWLPNDVIQATANPTVTGQYGVSNANSGYQFWFFNPDGGYSRRVLQTHAAPGPVTGVSPNIRASFLRLNSLVTQPLPFYTNLNVRIRTQVAGVYSEFGPACRFRLDPPCNTTQLTATADPVVSCGATGLSLSSTIYATEVFGATNYQFEFSRPGYLRRLTASTRSVALSFVTNPLQNNNCYNVRLRVSFDNAQTYCPFGAYCTITVGTALCGQLPGMMAQTDGLAEGPETRMAVWPNPSDGTEVGLRFTGFEPSLTTVAVDVTDAYGKLVHTGTIPVQDGYLNTRITFEQVLAPGLYLVNLQAGDQRFTERLVIQ